MEFLRRLFSSGDFMPHGYCYLWNPGLVWLHVVSDLLITVAYLSIPLTLVYFARKRRDVPFNWMFVYFGVFIVACGATHAMEIWNLWHAAYWFAGFVKAITAAASVPTAVLLVHLVPKALALPSPEVVIRANSALEKEVRERRDAELALHEREGRIQSLNEDLMRRAVELEALNKELEAFSYSVSHDLRAPLRHIDGFSRILLEEFAPRLEEEPRHHLQRIADAAQHMGHLVDDLLNLSRLGRTELTRKPVGLNKVLREVLHEISSGVMTDREIEWRIGDLPVAECDPGLIKVVFTNLLSNAIKFTRAREHAVIEVSAATREGEQTIFVRDNGVGFDMKYADKLFGVFQRLHRHEDFQGTGIGLATIQRIVHKHGGRIWAEAEPDRGATFYFTLPTATGRTAATGVGTRGALWHSPPQQ